MFRDTLKLPVKTPYNPFIAPVNIKVIESFMQKVGYQGVVDKLEKDYQSIKDDISLVSVYSTGNVLFQGMPIPDAFLTDEILATNDYVEYKTVIKGGKDEESYASKFVASILDDDINDSGNRLEPKSHKENPKVIDDDDVNDDEKKYEKKDDVEDKDNNDHTNHALVSTQKMGSLEFRTEQM
uniref:Uncharacterized protein n=1 Tax=Tanacetum cinerariifolium TaxID=118510 RepID=A0A6L2MI76_TANCI|nr:hypothetical protein [Tanacetum cinerariifolium]